MSPPREPLFLERQTYRRRRLMDAARFLPFAAGFLFVVPVLWAGASRTSAGIAYVFGLWLVLIGVAGLLSWHLAAEDRGDPDRAEGDRD